MTFAPRPLLALRDLWVANGGVHLGIVGGPRHTSGYHLGRDRIFSATGQAGRDYSIQHHRDVGFLTNAAAAIDLGRLNGTLEGLQEFSRWLVARCQAEPEAYRDIREVIYSPDGRTVLRWDHYLRRLFPAGTGTGQGDDSHLMHTHIGFPRDSETRDKLQLFAPYFEEATMLTLGGITVTSSRRARTLRSTPLLRAPAGTRVLTAPAGRIYPLLGADGEWRLIIGRTAIGYADGVARDTGLWVRAVDVALEDAPPVARPRVKVELLVGGQRKFSEEV